MAESVPNGGTWRSFRNTQYFRNFQGRSMIRYNRRIGPSLAKRADASFAATFLKPTNTFYG